MLNHKSYQEAADDIYKDLIGDIEILRDEYITSNSLEGFDSCSNGLQIAIDYLKEKRSELYG